MQDSDQEPDYERYIFDLQLTAADKKRELSKFRKVARKVKARLKTDQDAIEDAHIRTNELVNICCPNCYKQKLLRTYGDRISKCKSCRKEFRVLAQFAFFRDMKAPRAVMAMIDLLQAGCIFNAAQFKKEMKTSYDTSWHLMRELELIMLHVLADRRDTEAVDAACFSEALSRHSAAPQSVIKVRLLPEIRSTSAALQADIDALADLEKRLYEQLGAEHVSFESLLNQMDISVSQLSSALIVLELGGLVQTHPGDIFSRIKQEKPAEQSEELQLRDHLIDKIAPIPIALQACAAVTTNYLKVYFHGGFVEKYLALYETNIWRYKKLSEDPNSFSLFAACLAFDVPGGSKYRVLIIRRQRSG